MGAGHNGTVSPAIMLKPIEIPFDGRVQIRFMWVQGTRREILAPPGEYD